MSRGIGDAQRAVLCTLRECGEMQLLDVAGTVGRDGRQVRRAVRSLETRSLVATRKGTGWDIHSEVPTRSVALYVRLTDAGLERVEELLSDPHW